MIGGNKKELFKFIKDRIWRKINSWGGRSLSKAGKEVMIKSMLQAIPTYFMSIFLIPSSLGEDIQKIMNSFWWGSGGDRNKGIRWMSWDKLTISKNEGDMGFRNLYVLNIALLGKQGWRLMTQSDTLVAKLFKAKYYPKCDFLEAKRGNNSSYVWRSLHKARVILKEGTRWCIGSRGDIKVFRDLWVHGGIIAQSVDEAHYNPSLRVCDLMLPGRKSWNKVIVRTYLDVQSAELVLNTPLFFL